jgi:hypothetical protein
MTIQLELVALLSGHANRSDPNTRSCSLTSRSCSHIRWPTGCRSASLAILGRGRAYSAAPADRGRIKKSSASVSSRMRSCVGFGSKAVLTFPFLSGLRYFTCFGKTCRLPWIERRGLLQENRACFLASDDLLGRSVFPLARQAHRHFYSRSRRTDLRREPRCRGQISTVYCDRSITLA